jgi:hypothetical protein
LEEAMSKPPTQAAAEQLAAAAYQLPSDISGLYAAVGDLGDILGRVQHISRELSNRIRALPADRLGVDELGGPAHPTQLINEAIEYLTTVGTIVVSARGPADQAQSTLSRLYLNDRGNEQPSRGLHVVDDHGRDHP